jgi:hypothetical protein
MTLKSKACLILVLLTAPVILSAQTGGPGQPEFMTFTPASTSDLVNPSTGSFSYNIPLFDVGGYPVNHSYQSGVGMEEVASTVGLGWNLNIGEVTHTMRGLPDDFKGENVVRTIYMKPNVTYGVNMGGGMEIAGFGVAGGMSTGLGIFYNSYYGFGAEGSFGTSFSMHNKAKTANAGIGVGIKANSQSGVDIYAQPSVSMSTGISADMAASGSLSGMVSINSREGLKQSVNASMDISVVETYNKQKSATDKTKIVATKADPDKTVSESVISASASYSFSKTPEIPRVSYPYRSIAFMGNAKLGAEVYFMHPHAEFSGFFTAQLLSTNVIATPAYGFLYADQAPTSDNILHDHQREKDQPYIKDASINIGIPFYTNDIYSVNAQGINGSFQLNRGDVGVVFDNHVESGGNDGNVGGEIGAGNAFHVGVAMSNTTSTSTSGKWSSTITNTLKFIPTKPNALYQSAYFRNASDVSVDANGLFEKLKGDQAVEVLIGNESSSNTLRINEYDNAPANETTIPSAGYLLKSTRDPRTVNIQYLTGSQAASHGLQKTTFSYPVNQFDCSVAPLSRDRVDSDRKGHHISQITSTNTDGMRYVFGLPTYNTYQKEVAFTLLPNQNPTNDGLVPYSPSTQWGTNGKDGFYESTELPPYVTSHLLTAVLTPEYIDVDGNGPSIDDVGNYVKINYTYAGIYDWRTPYASNKATFNRAFLSDPDDNKGSYVYGRKELWYTHSVESKTEIAEFYYDHTGRKDGLGVVGEHGGKNVNQRLFRLDSIKVYSIAERVSKGNLAEPIRIIHFSYDYELCPGIENSADNGGKLTLKKLAFSSGKSDREMLSPYRFSYGVLPSSGVPKNPAYEPRNVNRFGHYQENISTSDINILTSTSLSNIDFPYALQNEGVMTDNAYAWNLTNITLPSRGTIGVRYEPHHYAYTQNQRAMEMFKIESIGSNPTDPATFGNSIRDNNFVRIALPTALTAVSAADQRQELLNKYFNNDLGQFYYYKALVNLTPGYQEWISGYCKIENVGVTDPSHAILALKTVCRGDGNEDAQCMVPTNPIQKNAWQFMRMNRQDLCYGPAGPINGVDLETFFEMPGLISKVTDQVEAFAMGFNNYAYAFPRNFAATIDPSKSFFRLYSPQKNKITGGSRVRQIISDDNWGQQTANAPAGKTYTIDYDYTDTELNPVTQQLEKVSTGVMEYEPFNGQDENPLRQPLFMEQHIEMAPDNRLYIETPINESLFPASNLVYSKVTVTSNRTTENVPGTGYQVIESFTAKDYPVASSMTFLGDNHEQMTDPLSAFASSLFGLAEFHDYLTLSQGFAITLNDMHGKQKATSNYNSKGSLVSSEKYEYAIGSTLNLISQNDVVYPSNKLGISVSAICDSRRTEQMTQKVGINTNLDMTFAPMVPLTLFVPLPDMMEENSRISTVALNKIIYKKGILIRKTVTENTATVATEHMLFDDRTGQVVLSKTTNEFNDTLFKYHYPADWIYAGVGPAYISSDLDFTCAAPGSGFGPNDYAVVPDVYKAVTVGDMIVKPNATGRYWVMAKLANNRIRLAGEILGSPVAVTPTEILRILRPGRRNQLMQEAGSVVTLVNPIVNNRIVFSTDTSKAKVINASMQEFADQRIKYCECEPAPCEPTCEPTPAASWSGYNVSISGSHAAMFLLGDCNSGCTANPAGPWIPGSVIRFRMAAVRTFEPPQNSGVTSASCSITTQLPPGFTYLGNPTYLYDYLAIDPIHPMCCLTAPPPPPFPGQLTTVPAVGSSQLTWAFSHLPIVSNSNHPRTLVVDFDVLVGTQVVPGKYCESFTVTSTQLFPSPVPFVPTVTTSNIAQVTISPSPNAPPAVVTQTATVPNPYLTGEKGSWYPTTTWSFLTTRERSVAVPASQTNIRKDGAFGRYKNFWIYSTPGTRWQKSTSGWQWVETVTKKDVNGLTLETSDVLKRHNALLTGYKHKLVVAEAGNAKIDEIFFEGFDDWNYLTRASNCDTVPLCVPTRIPGWMEAFATDAGVSHTGKFAGKLSGSGSVFTIPVIKNTLVPSDTDPFQQISANELPTGVSATATPLGGPSVVSPTRSRAGRTETGSVEARPSGGDDQAAAPVDVEGMRAPDSRGAPAGQGASPAVCAGTFRLLAGKRYVVSAWVHKSDPMAVNFDDPAIRVGSSTFQTGGNIIDGWQRITGDFVAPAGSSVEIEFDPGAGAAWFDDIRIFPFDAKMMTYVYDGNTQKLTYTNDENNFFTKYNYDTSNNLESINRETERGVQTVKEARSANAKRP